MLFDDLKKANMEALKAKDATARAALGLAINKAMLLKIEKRSKNEELTDNDVLVIINKSIKELDEEILAFKNANRAEKVEELEAQRKVLEVYLPKMLSEDEIRSEIAKLEDKSMPAVMKHFKANFAGRVDMKLVNKIANE
jgi:hypothetical protein